MTNERTTAQMHEKKREKTKWNDTIFINKYMKYRLCHISLCTCVSIGTLRYVIHTHFSYEKQLNEKKRSQKQLFYCRPHSPRCLWTHEENETERPEQMTTANYINRKWIYFHCVEVMRIVARIHYIVARATAYGCGGTNAEMLVDDDLHDSAN